MTEFSRRTLLGGAAATAVSAMWSKPVRAQYVWQKTDWHAGEYQKLTQRSSIWARNTDRPDPGRLRAERASQHGKL